MSNKNNRKVGAVIIMHPNHNNCGTSLQGFATVQALTKLGCDFRIIRYIKKRSFWSIIKTAPGLLKSGALAQIKKQIKEKKYRKSHKDYCQRIKVRTDKVNEFKRTYFDSISDFYVGEKNLKAGSKNYDVIFVGSDQVWGPLSLYAGFFNLLFVDDAIPKFSYASSFGVSNILKHQRSKVKAFLERLDAIGVREERGKEIVEELTDCKAQVVADPTFLLTKSEWLDYASKNPVKVNSHYVFAYILGERQDIRDEVTRFAKTKGLPLVCVPYVDRHVDADDNFGDIRLWDIDAFDFVNLINNADYVFTDSFHGSVFSIILQKPFITFYRQLPSEKGSTHSRIDNLLDRFGLRDRLYNPNIKGQMETPVDFSEVEPILEHFRLTSLDFLIENLKRNDK